MPIASIRFTADFLIVALQRYRRQHGGRFFSLTVKLLGLLLFVPMAVAMFWQNRVAPGLLFTGLSVFMVYSHHLDYWLARRSFRKSPYHDEEVTIELTEAGFRVHSPKQDVMLQWSAFTKVAHFKDGFLLFQGPKVFNWIPLSSLGDAAQAAELETLLRSKILQHKVVELRGVPAPSSGQERGGA